jgi:hypothetical protein
MDGRPNAKKRATRTARVGVQARRAVVPKDPLVEAARRHAISANGGRVVELMARRALLVAARNLLHEHIDRCTKCGSSFVTHEPAFVHCHYCGRMHRIANASLMEQEVFEIRMGLRLAS